MVKSSPDERGPDNREDTFTRFEFGRRPGPFVNDARGERKNEEFSFAEKVGVISRIIREIYRWQGSGGSEGRLTDITAHNSLCFGGIEPDVLGKYIKVAVSFIEANPGFALNENSLVSFLRQSEVPAPKNRELVELLNLVVARAANINREAQAGRLGRLYPRALRGFGDIHYVTPDKLGELSQDATSLWGRSNKLEAFIREVEDILAQ